MGIFQEISPRKCPFCAAGIYPSYPTRADNFAFTFDHNNRLEKVQIGATAADTVTYKINGLGQRVLKTAASAQATNATALGKNRALHVRRARALSGRI
jgi:hypothetical protein